MIDISDLDMDDLLKAYQLDVGPCGQCHDQQRCKKLPKCSIEALIRKYVQHIQHAAPPIEARKEDIPYIGLKNSSCVCYMNVFLQMFFLNTKFCTLMYEWHPKKDGKIVGLFENASYIADEKSVLAQLQLLFARMQTSADRYLDPNIFCSSMKIRPELQEDCQEFLLAFLTCRNYIDCNIRKLYESELAVTKLCLHCNAKHTVLDKQVTWEMPLNRHTLEEIVNVDMGDQEIENFVCPSCKQIGLARKSSKFITLPQTLIVQFHRATFDSIQRRTIKVSKAVEIPFSLDVSKLSSENIDDKEKGMYALRGIVSHLGPDPNQGHYILNYRDRNSGAWYSFNDTDVTHLNPNFLIESKQVVVKKEKHSVISDTAYLVIYEAVSVVNETEPDVPPWLKSSLSNQGCIRQNLELEASKAKMIKEKHDFVEKAIELSKTTEDNDPGQIMPTAWLKTWLQNGPGTYQLPLDYNNFLCIHGKVDIRQMNKLRVVSSSLATEIYKSNEEQRKELRMLKLWECLCSECALKLRQVQDLKEQIRKDKLQFQIQMNAVSQEAKFWVSKAYLSNWPDLAMAMTLKDTGGNEMQPECEEEPLSKKQRLVTTNFNKEPDCNKEWLNSDLVCPHGNLSNNRKIRRLVHEAAWRIMTKYFKQHYEFNQFKENCFECLNDLATKRQKFSQLQTELPNLLKQPLARGNAYQVRNNRLPTMYILDYEFVKAAISFLADPQNREPPDMLIRNRNLCCSHGLLSIDIGLNNEVINMPYDKSLWVMLEPEEWRILVKLFSFDIEIVVKTILQEEAGGMDTTKPATCSSCTKLRHCNSNIVIRVFWTKSAQGGLATVPSQQEKYVLTFKASCTVRDVKLKLVKKIRRGFGISDIRLFCEDGEELADNDLNLYDYKVYTDAAISLQVDAVSSDSDHQSDDSQDWDSLMWSSFF